ncbi:MAG TPA: DNA alkylation repair protein [Terriglobia bacterium]|nr:DNA alkylation repair protein [Terriglobia bacterium]
MKTTLATALAQLRKRGSPKNVAGMARYGIVAKKALGVSVGDIRKIAKDIGCDRALAQALWKTEIYEARMLACFLEDPAEISPSQMDRWTAAFDNWAICDTACFHLFDRSPHAISRIRAWAPDKREFVRRAAFALIASLALHDKARKDADFLRLLPLIRRAATDDRNFVKKGVSWALRGIGHRKSQALRDAALAMAKELAASSDLVERWIGKDALRDLRRLQEK